MQIKHKKTSNEMDIKWKLKLTNTNNKLNGTIWILIMVMNMFNTVINNMVHLSDR